MLSAYERVTVHTDTRTQNSLTCRLTKDLAKKLVTAEVYFKFN